MHRALIRSLVLLALAASAFATLACRGPMGQRRTLSTPTPVMASDPFGVARRSLAQMGYSIVDADRDAGFIRAEKERPSQFPWARLYDVLSVSIVPDEIGATVQVTAGTDMLPANGRRRPDSLSQQTVRDAQALIRALSGG